MAGKPGGSAPGGVPKFWAQTLGPVGQQPDTTTVLRSANFAPNWKPWTPPGGVYGFVDFLSGGELLPPPDTTHTIRPPLVASLPWSFYRIENRGWINQRTPLVAVIASGDGSAAGVGAASGIGAATAASTGSASGVGAASGIGAALDEATGTATGIGAASATGASAAASVGSASGTGTATGVSSATAAPPFLGAPIDTPVWRRYQLEGRGWTNYFTFQFINIVSATGSATGVGAASAVGASTAASIGSATGTGTATGVSDAVAAAIQARSPTFVPTWQRWRLENLGRVDYLSFLVQVQVDQPKNQYDWPNPRGPQYAISLRTWINPKTTAAAVSSSGQGTASGTGTATGIGASTAASTGSATGTGTALGISDVGTSTGSASGTGTATGIGAATAASTGSASGTGVATATGAATDASTGTATGVGAATGIGASTAAATGTASGTGTAAAVGDFSLAGQSTGSASGTGTAAAIGASTAAAVGNASGIGTAIGRSPDLAAPPGGAGFVHTFSRKRWRELQALIAAEAAAVAKAERLTTPTKREPLLQAARAAAAAVDAAQVEGENKRLDALLLRNADTLRKAIRANTEVKLLRETASAIEQSHAIVARNDDDEEMITLLLMF